MVFASIDHESTGERVNEKGVKEREWEVWRKGKDGRKRRREERMWRKESG